MTFKDIQNVDLEVFYNTDEFAKEATYKGKKVPVRIQKDEIEVLDISCERIKVMQSDFLTIQEGEEIEIEGVLYSILNFSPPKDFQISISIKEK
jgi:hypothetical protein